MIYYYVVDYQLPYTVVSTFYTIHNLKHPAEVFYYLIYILNVKAVFSALEILIRTAKRDPQQNILL